MHSLSFDLSFNQMLYPQFLQHRVQRKRFNELERAKKAEILERLKAERDLSNEIINTLKMSATGGFDAKASLTKKTNGSTVCPAHVKLICCNSERASSIAPVTVDLTYAHILHCLFSLQASSRQSREGFFITEGQR